MVVYNPQGVRRQPARWRPLPLVALKNEVDVAAKVYGQVAELHLGCFRQLVLTGEYLDAVNVIMEQALLPVGQILRQMVGANVAAARGLPVGSSTVRLLEAQAESTVGDLIAALRGGLTRPPEV